MIKKPALSNVRAGRVKYLVIFNIACPVRREIGFSFHSCSTIVSKNNFTTS